MSSIFVDGFDLKVSCLVEQLKFLKIIVDNYLILVNLYTSLSTTVFERNVA